jgi:hypothetical protein
MRFARRAGRHAAPDIAITWPPVLITDDPVQLGGSALDVPRQPDPAATGEPSPAVLVAEAFSFFLADRRELPVFRGCVTACGWCGLHLPAGWPMS